MDDKEFRKLDIVSRIAPGAATWPTAEDVQFVHWTRLHNTVEEARARLLAYREAIDEINGDPRLSDQGKRAEKRKAAQKALGAFSGSKSLQRAEQSVSDVLGKWDTKVREAVKPAANEAEAALHAEIRKHVAGLKGQARLAFLEKHAADPRVAASMLEAPKFLTNLTDGEELMIRNLIEARVLPPEIAQAKVAVTKAWGETEHGWARAQDLIGEDAGLRRAPDGSWAQPEQAKADAA